MEVSRQVVIAALRDVGRDDAVADAERLPDPVDSVTIVKFCEQLGLSREQMMGMLGGSP